MARALAVMSGYAEGLNARSMLNSMEGFQTLLFKSSVPIKSPYFVWNALKLALSVDVTSAVRGMTITEDESGAVFDMPVDKMAEVRSFLKPVIAGTVCVCVHARVPLSRARSSFKARSVFAQVPTTYCLRS